MLEQSALCPKGLTDCLYSKKNQKQMEVKEHIRKDVANVKQKEKKGIKENPVKVKRSVTHVKKEDKNKM